MVLGDVLVNARGEDNARHWRRTLRSTVPPVGFATLSAYVLIEFLCSLIHPSTHALAFAALRVTFFSA